MEKRKARLNLNKNEMVFLKTFLGKWLKASLFLLSFLVVFASVVTMAESTSINESVNESIKEEDRTSYVMCRHQNVVRTIRISELNGALCAVVYGKEGIDQQIAKYSKKDLCKNILKKIKVNLEKSAWKCKDVGQSEVLTELGE